jgi:uncharacterized protein YaiI (UPF0178 family)
MNALRQSHIDPSLENAHSSHLTRSPRMKIWVDADACPAPIREILFRAAMRTAVQTTLIANHALRIPPSPYLQQRIVPGGFDVADQAIVRARLNMRDFMDTLRGSGIHTGGPPPLSANDRKAFADHLDRWLARRGS